MRIAIVHDWLTNMGGAEKIVEILHNLFPDAPIYTLVYDRKRMPDSFAKMNIRTSYLQDWPLVRKRHQWLLQFMPSAIEALDLREFDLVISSSTSCAKGVLTRADCCHICYCNTPMRYAWDFYQDYLEGKNWLMRKYIIKQMNRIRIWDRITADRVDYFIANSHNVSRRIRKHYRRKSEVIYPPVDTNFFVPGNGNPEDYFLCAGRLVAYKQVELAVTVCSQRGLKLIVSGEGPEYQRLRAKAGPTIEFVGRTSDEELRLLYQNCRAFIFPGEEDFGITPLEAQACGRPVIAFARGGALETIQPSVTGIFFTEQKQNSLNQAIDDFIKIETNFNSSHIRAHAEGFSVDRFMNELSNATNRLYHEFNSVN